MYHRKVFSQDLKAGTFFETVKKEDYRRRRRVKQKWVKRIDDSFLKLFGATSYLGFRESEWAKSS